MAARSKAKSLVPVLESSAAGFEKHFSKLEQRRYANNNEVESRVSEIMQQVSEGGDAALLELIHELDGAKVKKLEVQTQEWETGVDEIDSADRAALAKSAMRVRDFHRRRIPSSWEIHEEGGGLLGQKVRPLHRVGIYVPGGKACYPSSVIMNAVPASVVDVSEIVMATPANADGSLSPEVLMAAKLAGVHRIFKMGGAQAIAAMAYGTETVPRVDKIVGPGNVWVATAKRLAYGQVDIDCEAGPSEILIVADKSATPAWLAADLLSQAEHDEQASAVLITPVKSIITRVQEQLTKQIKTLERSKIATKSLAERSAIIHTRNLDEAIALSERFAPEHLVLAIDSADRMVKEIENAGAVFIGHYTPEAVGDYIAGPSHVLPTGGTARFFSPLGVEDFMKRMSFMRFEAGKLRELGADVMRLAEMEGLGAHAQAIELRLQKIRRNRRERDAARGAEAEI